MEKYYILKNLSKEKYLQSLPKYIGSVESWVSDIDNAGLYSQTQINKYLLTKMNTDMDIFQTIEVYY